jgi:hypothetical protein
MSLVGPRPVIAEEVRWWGPCEAELLSVRPGVFGAWQLTDHMAYPVRAYLELAYVRSASFSLDLEILGKTCMKLARRRSYAIESLMLPRTYSARREVVHGVAAERGESQSATPFGSVNQADS